MITSQYPVFTLPTTPELELPAAKPTIYGERFSYTTKAYMALGLGVLFVSWSAIFVKWTAVPGATSAFYRALIASLVLTPMWAIRTRIKGKSPVGILKGLDKRTIFFAVLAGIMFAADLALYNTSILMTSAANATLLGNNAPIMVALATWLIFKNRPASSFWIGLSIASVGSVIIIGEDILANPHLGFGDLFAVLSAVCYAGYLMVVSKAREKLDTVTLVMITVVSSAVALFLIALVLGVPLLGFSAKTWGSLLFLGIVAQVGGYLAITYALGHLPATITSISLLVQAPLTALIAVPLLGETISMGQIIGGSFVLVGIYIVNKFSNKS